MLLNAYYSQTYASIMCQGLQVGHFSPPLPNWLRKLTHGLVGAPFLTMTLLSRSAWAVIGWEPWLLRTC